VTFAFIHRNDCGRSRALNRHFAFLALRRLRCLLNCNRTFDSIRILTNALLLTQSSTDFRIRPIPRLVRPLLLLLLILSKANPSVHTPHSTLTFRSFQCRFELFAARSVLQLNDKLLRKHFNQLKTMEFTIMAPEFYSRIRLPYNQVIESLNFLFNKEATFTSPSQFTYATIK
jgi:hypothetical protein